MSLLPSALCAQELPRTAVYLFHLSWQDSSLHFSDPKYLTAFNPNGYNNQPSFVSDDELLLTVGMAGEEQTDIYLLDLKKKQQLQLTKTAESEYSPQIMHDKLHFSVVRVEKDEERTQRLWQYPLDRKGSGKPVFRLLRGIGYYHLLDSSRFAVFNVANPNFLTIADTRDDATQYLNSDIGRCFGTSPNGNLVFVHKITEERHVIKTMDRNTLEVQEISLALPGSEDFVILEDGSILMGKGSRVYRMHPLVKRDAWKEVVDLKTIGVTQITRMALSRDGKLAVVTGGF
ncbi:MAG: hypothetical protein RLY31_2441 [Bacteroidota bacterium]